jgi:hypothetical protein
MQSIKRLLLLFCILPLYLFGQENPAPDLIFDQTFYDLENQWVVFPKKPADSVYAYGVVYVDAAAGFTFDLQGAFKVMPDGRFIGTPITNSVKVRLERNVSKVSALSADRLKELNLPKEAAFLSHYKVDPGNIVNLVSWGKHYNHVGAYERSLVYLLKAYKIEPHAEGLEFELAFNYNATSKFDRAVEVLAVAIKDDPKNFWFYRELGYSYMNNMKLEEAEKSYSAGIKMTQDSLQKSEMAYNIAYGFFKAGNKPKFMEWDQITRQHTTDPQSVFIRNLNILKHKLTGIN